MDALEHWKQRLMAEGEAKAFASAVERGRAIGGARAYFKVAIYLLKDVNLSLEEIAQVTTLDLDDI